MTEIEMSLGDGFTKRKQIQNDIQKWIRRLGLSGQEKTFYSVKELGEDSSKAITGTLKQWKRNYTIEECLDKLKELLIEDQQMALRISLTNQQAKAKMLDLDDKEVELTIPELIVLKNEIAPKMEQMYRSIPIRATGLEIIDEDDDYVKYRQIKEMVKTDREFNPRGVHRDIQTTVGYAIEEVTDYGHKEREIFDKTDKVQAWQERLKNAINQANKTSLINL